MPDPIFFRELESKEVILTLEEINAIRAYGVKCFDPITRMEKIEENQFKIELQCRHYIGLINVCNTLSFVILPKFENADFISMLEYIDIGRIEIWKEMFKGVKKQENFITQFITTFLNRTYNFLIQNMKRGYLTQVEDRVQPKGKILVKESIAESSVQYPPRITCQFTSFELNNPYNQIIKYTLQAINPLIEKEQAHLYHKIMSLLESVEAISWSIQQIEKLTYDRLNAGYKPIHDFCRLILEDFSIAFEQGEQIFFAFTINSWNVYERFLLEIFDRYQDDGVYLIEAYSPSDLVEDKDRDNKLRPDIIVSDRNSNKKVVIDAKYKVKPSKHDEDQVIRYIGNYNTDIGFLIYPFHSGITEEQKILEEIQQHERIRLITKYFHLENTGDREYLRKFVKETFSLID